MRNSFQVRIFQHGQCSKLAQAENHRAWLHSQATEKSKPIVPPGVSTGRHLPSLLRLQVLGRRSSLTPDAGIRPVLTYLRDGRFLLALGPLLACNTVGVGA